MNNTSSFFMMFFLNTFRHIGSVVLSVILIIAGAIWSEICLYIGLVLLAINIIVAFVSTLRMNRTMKSLSNDDPEFGEMLENISSNPMAFMSEIMNAQEENKKLHGEDLLKLSDDDLFETIYFQNLDIAEQAENEDDELEQFTGARRTVYILSTFDSEIQNGGLCQFFVNSSRIVAPYVSEALESINADEHRALFERFITENDIDVSDLNSFKVSSKRGYIKQTKRFDFDSFDDKYIDLPPIQEKVVIYIKNNIQEF